MQRQTRADGSPPVLSIPHADPGRLPVRFVEPDPGADSGLRGIELDAERVVVHRRRAGIAMTIRLPLSGFTGIAVALTDPEGESEAVELRLVHPDPGLSVRLYAAPHADDVVALWRRWSAVLGRPMLVIGADGGHHAAGPMLGRLALGAVRLRRHRRGALKNRRPAVFRRRSPGLQTPLGFTASE